MGSAYASVISDNPNPSVALLSNGAEPNKGTPTIKDAHSALVDHPSIHFIGNVEGLDLPRGTADVVVCDGFLGNVVLKMLEGVTEVVTDLAKDAYARKFLWRLGLTMLSQGLRQLRTMTDWKQYGGHQARIRRGDHQGPRDRTHAPFETPSRSQQRPMIGVSPTKSQGSCLGDLKLPLLGSSCTLGDKFRRRVGRASDKPSH